MTKISNQYSLTNVLTADVVNGRVGVNNGSPTVALDVTGAARVSGVATFSSTVESTGAYFQNGNAYFGKANEIFIGGSSNDGGLMVSGSNNLIFGNALAERMRITSGGNVGIGTTSPSSRLHVSGGDVTISNTTTTALRLNASSSSFQTSIYLQEAGVTRWEFGKLSTTPDFYVYGGNTPGFGLEIIFATRRLRLAAYGAGTLTTDASGNVTASSDSSLKNVIKPIKNVLENIKDFEPVYFKWNEKTDLDKENVYMSTIAQSIQKNYPEAVGKMEDGTLTVQDRAVTAILVAAIQELSADLTSAKQEIELLKAK
jgi:hypothetical protein